MQSSKFDWFQEKAATWASNLCSLRKKTYAPQNGCFSLKSTRGLSGCNFHFGSFLTEDTSGVNWPLHPHIASVMLFMQGALIFADGRWHACTHAYQCFYKITMKMYHSPGLHCLAKFYSDVFQDGSSAPHILLALDSVLALHKALTKDLLWRKIGLHILFIFPQWGFGAIYFLIKEQITHCPKDLFFSFHNSWQSF